MTSTMETWISTRWTSKARSGEHLGEVDGFIVDSESGRPYYVVVDAGGWFKSKHFLLPVGHVRFDADVEALKADLTRDRVERFPGFNKDEFDKLTADDLKKFNDQTLRPAQFQGPTTLLERRTLSAAWDRSDFHNRPGGARHVRLEPREQSGSTWPLSERPAQSILSNRHTAIRRGSGRRQFSFSGRAQPGDIVGIETGGKRLVSVTRARTKTGVAKRRTSGSARLTTPAAAA